jgi:AraC-like DNA-binding protein
VTEHHSPSHYDADVAQSTLALNLGYSDQAHFIRDFKTVVGTSPASYAKGAR